MNAGSKWRFMYQRVAYADQAWTIPATALIFDVELLDVVA